MGAVIKKEIPQIVAGGESLVSAGRANELIAVINAMLKAKVNPSENVGSISYSPTGFVFDLQALIDRVAILENLLGVDPGANGNSSNTNITNTVENLSNTVCAMISAINNANISCNSEDSTITLTIPNWPNNCA
jgi:hypothetical protein